MNNQNASLVLKKNCFDYFRIYAAIQVLFGHMISLYGISLPRYNPIHYVGGGADSIYTLWFSRNGVL